MESIDIIDPNFTLNISDSLDVVDVNDIVFSDSPVNSEIINGGSNSKDYTIFIYIGSLFFLFLIGMFIYKNYTNTRNKQIINENSDEKCSRGFCPVIPRI
jgi:hypothetical protein